MTAIRVNESSGSVGSLQIADGYGGFLSGSIIAGSNITIQDDGSGNFTIVGTGGSVIPSGDSNATYLVLSTTSSLSNERSLVPSAGLIGVDQGANSNYLLSVDDSVVATLTSSVSFPNGISGSLTQLSDGTSYIVAGDNITIASSSNGSIVITSTDTNTEYTSGTGLVLDTSVFSINDSVVATLTGSIFSGDLIAQSGLSGSLQRLPDGTSYLVAGTNISIVSQSNGSILLTATDTNTEYSSGTGLVLEGSEFSINNSVVATLTGSIFTGNIVAQSGLSGSLQNLSDGTSYLIAGNNTSIVSQSNGSVVISSTDTNTEYTSGNGIILTGTEFSVDDSIVATLTSSVSFSNGISGSLTQLADGTSYLIEGDNITIASSSNGSITISSVDTNTEYTAGTGLTLDSTTFNINDSIVATLTGSVFSGNIVAQSGLSGSLQQLADGSSYLVAGENITIVTGSNGQIIISSVTDTGTTVTNRIRNNYIVIEDVLSGSFFTANNSNFEEVNYDKELIDVFLNGQLQISGSDTQVGNSEADYHIFSSTQFKFGFDVFKDDIITVLTYPSTTNLERNKSDYILSSDVLSGSAITVSNNDFSIAASNSTLIDVYRNGQLLLSGTDAQVGNLEADYLIQSTNQIKLGYDVFKDDVFSVTVFNQSDTDKREKVDYPVNVDVLSGSVFNAASSDFGTANSSTNLIDIYHNGALLYPGTDSQVGNSEADYFFPDTNQIKFGFDIQEDDVVSVTVYRDATETVDAYAKYLVTEATDGLDNERVLTAGTGLQSSDGGAGGSFTISVVKEMVFNEKLGGIVDGSNTLFTLANTPFATNEISIFVNGQLQTPPDLTTWQDYSVTGSNVYFTTGSTPEAGSLILAMYNKVVS